MTNVKDRLIVITGASGGLGFGLLEQLLKKGYKNVVVQHRSPENRKKLYATLTSYDCEPVGERVRCVDLTDEKQTTVFADSVTREFGSPWAVVNMIGASSNVMSWKMSAEQFKSIIDANLLTTFLSCKSFIPKMRGANCGRIINVSSVVGFTGVAGASHYCAAKAGVVGLTRSLALELAPKNITVNVLALGYFDSGLIMQVSDEARAAVVDKTPAKKLGTSLEVAGIVEYLLGDSSAFTTGQSLHVNGGLY